MNKKVSLGAALAFALMIAVVVFVATMSYSTSEYNSLFPALTTRQKTYQKLSDIEQTVRQNYYGAGTINQTELDNSLARGYVAGINDPHAIYYTAEEYARIEQESRITPAGIGAVLSPQSNGFLLVQEVYPDSPAQLSGITAGSEIIRVDDVALNTSNNYEMLASITGTSGSQVTLVVRKDGEEQTLELTRQEVVVPTVHAEMLSNSKIGYIWIKDFDANTSNQFNRELKTLQDAGAQALIFDLRGTSGEDMRSAVRIMDRIVPEGPLFVTEYSDGSVMDIETSDATELTLPMVTITNKNTSGAAELFVQVLKDYNKAKSVGTVTAGMGVRQDIVKLSDGSAVKLSVAMYKTSRGGVIFDKIGIVPDFEVAMTSGVEDWTAISREQDPQFAKAYELVATSVSAIESQVSSQEESSESSSEPTSSSEQSVSSSQSPVASEQPVDLSGGEGEESSDESSDSGESGSEGDESSSSSSGESTSQEESSSSSSSESSSQSQSDDTSADE
ncbi:MAG: S41 family peptidase [Oscillospiraceae bacterium]